MDHKELLEYLKRQPVEPIITSIETSLMDYVSPYIHFTLFVLYHFAKIKRIEARRFELLIADQVIDIDSESPLIDQVMQAYYTFPGVRIE